MFDDECHTVLIDGAQRLLFLQCGDKPGKGQFAALLPRQLFGEVGWDLEQQSELGIVRFEEVVELPTSDGRGASLVIIDAGNTNFARVERSLEAIP